MGHFVDRRMVCIDDEISYPTYLALGDKPFPTRFIDEEEGYLYFSFCKIREEVWYKRRKL